MTKLISGRVAKVGSANVSAERYQFIGLSETEPDLGLPAVSGYVLSSDLSGNRIWVDAASASGLPFFANTSGIANVALTANIANTVLTLSNFTTANLVEGINLYYTNARVLSFITPYLTTANVLESASNLYYTNARVISAVLPYLTTSNVAEGTNLYYTNARVYSNVTATLAGNITIGNATIGNVSISGSTTFGAGSGGSLTGANLISASYIQTGNLLATSGNILITGNIIPSIDSTFNFGSLDKQWKDFYLSAESLYVGGQKISGNAQTGLTLVSLTASNITTGNLVVTNSFVGNVTGTVSSLSNFTTSNLAEGTNQYFTNARVTANLSQQSVNVFSDVDTTGITTNGILVWNGSSFIAGTIDSGATANIALFANTAGTANVAQTANVANTVLSLSNFTTTNLAEGTNLYHTNARTRSAFIAGKGIRIFADGTIKSVAAGGEYNQGLDGGVAYMVSNVTAGVTFTGATSNDRFILRSMQVTNISNNVAYISSNVLYADGNTGYLGNLITVPQGGFVEFMGRTQIFQPNDSIYFQGFDNNYTPTSNILSAYLTYESVASDISYVGLGRTMANANANVVLVTADVSDFILESIKFVNLKTIDAPVTLYLANATTAVPKAYLAFNMIVPGTSSLEILQSAKLLKYGDSLYARYANSSNADSIAVFTSYRKADATSLSSTTPSVSSTDTASIVFNTTISEGTTLYYTIE
jgi:hypothetical protein